jgi:hypothetical protein
MAGPLPTVRETVRVPATSPLVGLLMKKTLDPEAQIRHGPSRISLG